jgi:hypothetical protein
MNSYRKQAIGRRILILAALATMAAFGLAFALDPASLTTTNYRGTVSIELATPTQFYQGDVLRGTNCVMYTGADTNSALQDLTGCGIVAIIGNSSSNVSCTTWIENTNGVYGFEATIPSNVNPCYIQITVTSTVDYTYWQQKVGTVAKME